MKKLSFEKFTQFELSKKVTKEVKGGVSNGSVGGQTPVCWGEACPSNATCDWVYDCMGGSVFDCHVGDECISCTQLYA